MSRPAHLVTLHFRERDGKASGSNWATFQVARQHNGAIQWVDTAVEFHEWLGGGRVAYYSHQWRIVFHYPMVGENDPQAFAQPVTFERGQSPIEVVRTSRRRH